MEFVSPGGCAPRLPAPPAPSSHPNFSDPRDSSCKSGCGGKGVSNHCRASPLSAAFARRARSRLGRPRVRPACRVRRRRPRRRRQPVARSSSSRPPPPPAPAARSGRLVTASCVCLWCGRSRSVRRCARRGTRPARRLGLRRRCRPASRAAAAAPICGRSRPAPPRRRQLRRRRRKPTRWRRSWPRWRPRPRRRAAAAYGARPSRTSAAPLCLT